MGGLAFVEHVQRNEHFAHLIKDLHLTVVPKDDRPGSFDGATVELQSADCVISIYLDRGVISLYMGPRYVLTVEGERIHDVWFNSSVIAAFLSGGQDRWEFQRRWPGDWDERIDRQLTWFGEKMQPYWERACALFR